MEEKRKQLRRQIEELSLDERIMEMRSPVEDVETASNNKYHYISENSIQTLLYRAREEGRREVIHKLKEEIDMAEVSEFIDAHQDFFNSFGKSMLLKISKLITK